MLRQASQEQTRVPSLQIPTSGMTLSLASLDDAHALKQKEWSRGEPGEDALQMFTTIGGHLIPTAPVYGDMRADVTLNVTTEEPPSDLPATMRSIKDRESMPQTNDEERDPTSHAAPPATGIPETSSKMVNVRSNPESSTGRNTITRETSREDALAATRLFFNTVNERRNVPEVPVSSTTGVTQIDTPHVLPDPIETESTEQGTTSPQVHLPNGSPPRPTATATCRPQTWVQCISEGHIEEHSREDEDSVESAPLEPLVLEGLPDDLGPEWRILHPFELPGVRILTDDIPPNPRRLAESDALGELIQTAEYLEDAPSSGQRRFYLPQYGDPFYRGHGRGHGRGRGRGRSWLSKVIVERDSSGGQGRISHGNGRSRKMFWRTDKNNRQGRDWSISTHVGERNNTQQESELPPTPLPSRFSDWSSL